MTESIEKLLDEYRKSILCVPEYIMSLHWDPDSKEMIRKPNLNPKHHFVRDVEQQILQKFRELELENGDFRIFIKNGVEMGYIHIPEEGDPAYDIYKHLKDGA